MKRKSISLMLLTSILLTLASCGGESAGSGETTTAAPDATTAPVETEFVYDFSGVDLGGEDFSVLNTSTTWGFYTAMDIEEQTGEALDDAVYSRNRFVEEKYNVVIDITEESIDTVADTYRTAVMAGDDIYDLAYIRCDRIASFIADESLYNLLDYPEFRLDEEWWDQTVIEKSTIGSGDKLYFASNDFSLMGFDGTLCCYFNEDMLADLGLETPYRLVRDGKWTIDRLTEYAKTAANLNGDESFAWDEKGNAIYGLASYDDSMNGFITGSGLNYITLDGKGQPVLLADSERFYNVVDKAHALYSTEGAFIFMNDSGDSHYEMIFKNGRSLFTIAEIKASSKYRDMRETFGIVPIPKYDEAQDEYYSHRTHVCLTMSMPKTNTNPTGTAQVMDALAYLSMVDVLPIYYNVKVAQKGLRNDESIEMLGIISKSRGFDIGEGYGWTEQLSAEVNTALANRKENNIASLVDSHRPSVEAAIEKTMEYMS